MRKRGGQASAPAVVTFKIGGIGGQGQQAAGLLFAKVFARQGYWTCDWSEFPSIIRGGHGTYQVSVGRTPVTAAYRTVHLLVALSQETANRSIGELADGGAVVFDADKVKVDASRTPRVRHHALPIAQLLQSAGASPRMANTVAVGASLALLDDGLDAFASAIRDTFGDKGEGVVQENLSAAKAGFDYARTHFDPATFAFRLAAGEYRKDAVVLTANDAVSLGAVAAGCKLYVAYPMSPSSSILHNLAGWATLVGMVVHQPEDEIAGVHVAIGAAYAGTRSMVGTSGGGFALMNEAVALAAMTETPLVLVECQRPGPATGLPTWTEQGDLKYVANCGHGDFPRAILAPADPAEAFAYTTLAFDLAERYQSPVFLLLDKYLCDGHWSVRDLRTAVGSLDRGKIADHLSAGGYQRYALTPDGVSSRALPGTPGGAHLANSDEHDATGTAVEAFHAPWREKMMDKRMAKGKGLAADLPQPKLYGPAKAKLTLLGWGSTRGPVLEALKALPNVNYVHVPAPFPVPVAALQAKLKGVKRVVAIENNATGQFATLYAGASGHLIKERLLKYDGRQFWPEEIVDRVSKLV